MLLSWPRYRRSAQGPRRADRAQTPPAMSPEGERRPLRCCWAAASSRPPGESRGRPASRPNRPGLRRRLLRPLVSPERHTCSWQLLPPAPGPEAGSELALRCEGPDGARHQCAYRGEPGRCAVYAARRSHYWKQVLSVAQEAAALPHLCSRPACAPARRAVARSCAWCPRHSRSSPQSGGGLNPGSSSRAGSRGSPESPRSAWWQGPCLPRALPKRKPSEQKPKGGRGRRPGTQTRSDHWGPGLDPDGLDENAAHGHLLC